jgi:hypothetical protein
VDGAKGDGGEVKKENLNKNKGSSDAAFVFRDNRESRAKKENESGAWSVKTPTISNEREKTFFCAGWKRHGMQQAGYSY